MNIRNSAETQSILPRGLDSLLTGEDASHFNFVRFDERGLEVPLEIFEAGSACVLIEDRGAFCDVPKGRRFPFAEQFTVLSDAACVVLIPFAAGRFGRRLGAGRRDDFHRDLLLRRLKSPCTTVVVLTTSDRILAWLTAARQPVNERCPEILVFDNMGAAHVSRATH